MTTGRNWGFVLATDVGGRVRDVGGARRIVDRRRLDTGCGRRRAPGRRGAGRDGPRRRQPARALVRAAAGLADDRPVRRPRRRRRAARRTSTPSPTSAWASRSCSNIRASSSSSSGCGCATAGGPVRWCWPGRLPRWWASPLVLDVFGGVRLDGVGVAWGLAAAVGLAVYFVVASDDREPVPPLVLSCAALWTGALTLVLAAAAGACTCAPRRRRSSWPDGRRAGSSPCWGCHSSRLPSPTWSGRWERGCWAPRWRRSSG